MSKERVSQYDVIILGGGLNGAAMGLAVAHAGLKAVIVDHADPKVILSANYDGRTCAIAAASKSVLEMIGAWQFMDKDAQPILDIKIADGHSPLVLNYDYKDVGDQPLGYILENRITRSSLYKAIAVNDNVEMIAPARVDRIERDAGKVALILEDGCQLQAPLLIGAEGRKSIVRDWAGIKTYDWSYDQSSIVCTVRHQEPHNGLAVEHFLPSGPFAILPMTDNRCSIVWTEKTELADYLVALDEQDFIDELHRRVDGYLGELELVGPRFCYPLGLQHAYRYTDARVALVGDAAHGMHPIAGQGLNMGLRDVAALAEILVDARRLGRDIGGLDVLSEYEQWRRFDNTVMLAVTDVTNRLFSNDIAPVRWARDLGLAVVEKLPPLKRTFMSHAMGYSGELPKLMRGETL